MEAVVTVETETKKQIATEENNNKCAMCKNNQGKYR